MMLSVSSSVYDFINNEAETAACSTKETWCSNLDSCNVNENVLEQSRVFGLPLKKNGICVAVYPRQSDSLGTLLDSYNKTLSSFLSHNVFLIVVLSHLIPPSFSPLDLFDKSQQMRGLDRTHILSNHLNLVPEPTSPSQLADHYRIQHLTLLSSYANYNLNCASFVAVEAGMEASTSLASQMESLLESSRLNLMKHLTSGSSLWRSTGPYKLTTSLYRVSFKTGSHLMLLNLGKGRNYIEKMSQVLLKIRPRNMSLIDFLESFSHMQAAFEPTMVLPPLIVSPEAPVSDIVSDKDVHPDMGLEKSSLLGEYSLSVKATYTNVPSVFEYSLDFITKRFGYFKSHEIFYKDFIIILFEKQYTASLISLKTGTTNQPAMQLSSGSVYHSPLAQMSKSGKIACSHPVHAADFVHGQATAKFSPRVNIRCVIIRINCHQPQGFIISSLQVTS